MNRIWRLYADTNVWLDIGAGKIREDALREFKEARPESRIILSPVLVEEMLLQALEPRKVSVVERAAVHASALGSQRFAKDIPELLQDDILSYSECGRPCSLQYDSMSEGHALSVKALALLRRCASVEVRQDIEAIKQARQQNSQEWNALCDHWFEGYQTELHRLPREEQLELHHDVRIQQEILGDAAWWALGEKIIRFVLADTRSHSVAGAPCWRRLRSLDAIVRALYSYALNIKTMQPAADRRKLRLSDRDDAMHMVYGSRCDVFVTSDCDLLYRLRLVVPHVTVLGPDDLSEWVRNRVAGGRSPR